MRENLATFVQDFERYGRQIAVATYPGNRRVRTSYAQLAALTGSFSRLLADRKMQRGDRVLLWGANSAEWVAAFFGCVLRGVLVVPLDAGGSAELAARVLADVTPRLVVGDPSLLQKLPDTVPKFLLQDVPAYPREPLLTPESSLNRETPLQILYTSGTTSSPKGIVHTHGNVLASVEVLEREMEKYLRYERWVHPLRFLHTLPLSHVFGQFMGLWVPPLLGAEVHYEDKLAADHLIGRIHRERISVAAVVPRVLELMRAWLLAGDPQLGQRIARVQYDRAWKRWWRLRDVHRRFGFKFWAFVSGGATLPEEVEQFWNALGFVLVQGYGMTETTALATLNHPLHTARGSIGKPLAGREVRIAEDGEILVKGAMLAAGTWRDGSIRPRAEEWLHTGDLGSMDADGALHFIGRKSDLIVAASGLNIHPADLEAAVEAQPGVHKCVVVGWESPRGAEPVAVLILEENSGAKSDEVLSQVLTGANRTLQEFQQMRQALRWPANEFPHNSMGKLLRREVAAWVQQQLRREPQPAGVTVERDPLLRLLQQVTGESAAGMEDSTDLATHLPLDSLGRMQLAMGMEEQFGTPVGDEAIAAAKTLGDLKRLVSGPRTVRSEALDRSQRAADIGYAGLAKAESPSTQPFRRPRASSHSVQYVRWPWSGAVQAVRVAFLECIVRPLVAVLAHPQVQCDSAPLPTAPSIYICNHVSVIDVPLVLFSLPRSIRRHMAVAMSAELLEAWRRGGTGTGVGGGPLRWLAPLQVQAVTALFNVFPLPARAGLRKSFSHAGEALDRGYNVLVFPEGQRTLDGALQPFQTGISLLAQESNTAVVPVALAGLWQAAQHRFRFLMRLGPSRLVILVGAPQYRANTESHVQFAARLRSAVERLIGIAGETRHSG